MITVPSTEVTDIQSGPAAIRSQFSGIRFCRSIVQGCRMNYPGARAYRKSQSLRAYNVKEVIL